MGYNKEIIVNIAIGKGVRNLAEKISKKYNVALYQASRLVQTETSAIRNRATLDRYKEEGIEKYQIIAVRDSKTSKICQSMDMKIFNTKDQVIGVNYPPFHINCRSTTKAYFEFLEEDDNKTTPKEEKPFKTLKMSYKEWEKKYVVDKNKNNAIIEENKKEKFITPKTLLAHEKHIKTRYGSHVKGVLKPEDEKIVSEQIKKILDENELSMRFRSYNIDKLLESGKFMNQFETGTSGGTIAHKFRKQATENLFGIDLKKTKLKKSDFEKYGYLAPKSFNDDVRISHTHRSLDQYGDVIIRFDKKKLADRVTYTIDDSLGLAVNKHIIADKFGECNLVSMEKHFLKQTSEIAKNKNGLTLENILRGLDVRYIELQYHGDIKATDIVSICFTKNTPSDASINKLKELGIKVFRLEGDKNVEM